MMDNDLLSDRQFGSLQGRLTVLQLLKFMDAWTEALDAGHNIDAVYMDFQKKFDKVPHQCLLSKMRGYSSSLVRSRTGSLHFCLRAGTKLMSMEAHRAGLKIRQLNMSYARPS